MPQKSSRLALAAALLLLPALALGQLRAPDEDDQTPPGASVAGGKVASLLVFEGPAENLPKDQRIYRQSFDAARTRFIFYELDLKYPAALPRDGRFDIQAVCVRGNGEEVFRISQACRQDAGWTSSHHSSGWGRPSTGGWKPGAYTLKILHEGREVAVGSFRID
ncbi:hypothetical protein NNJEOMEG_03825 [Fundidesulfovibrio magnetotacticus]|uniref:FlgD Ig-like domain-containing protein n=1 Tax=Fundidesulfovibrio magnetotacticus TaxID=2730080 RepID=A0A6V8LU02_9BACT|nr:hypothetical protein [Fundidesulfovibrio magnetotacticus]GFK95952.1 hypothetical protein NNJEOMEG_03825 [Fundidesulfovibrio magnetotacticus]